MRILHVDMDAFYASVEQRDDARLAGRPVIVGGDARRGVVLAASYEARRFGVHSAMPMARALKAAPSAVVLPPRFEAYVEASEAVFRIFERYTPLVEPLSLDEAFLDVTASLGLFGDAVSIAADIRAAIRAEVGLPASAGIADVKFVAKIASDLAKPNGQREVPAGTARAFLEPLPVWRLWGVGPKLRERLEGLGLKTVGDVARADAGWLAQRLGSSAQHLWKLSHGLDERGVVADREAKSIGAQDTFPEDIEGLDAARPHLHGQALRVGRRLRRAGVRARVVQLVVKYGDFSQLTRQRTVSPPTDDGQRLYREVLELAGQVDFSRPVRLTGVAAHELTGGEEQLALFGAPVATRAERLNAAIDGIAAKFGSQAVVTADLAHEADDGPRDGFYREEKRRLGVEAERQRADDGPVIEREPGEDG